MLYETFKRISQFIRIVQMWPWLHEKQCGNYM